MGATPLFDFNHAFEADVNFQCIPYILLNKRISMLDAAIDAVNHLHYVPRKVKDVDKYTAFYNSRVDCILRCMEER